MRVMAKITVPVESGNQALKDASIAKIIQATAERWKPEATYLGPFDGRRTLFIVFDLANPSDIFAFTEPWFQGVNAAVEINPVMSVDDVQEELAKLG